ncbi:MAG TPA: DUF2167 domain-containing protein [Rhizobiaceae bacterium]|nr:DUF2167 domain-containing protein [Rhizobiaceae bacterium]
MKHLRSLLCVAALAPCFLAGVAAPAHAQALHEILARPFDHPLTLARGTLDPIGPGAEYYTHEDACRVLHNWGWTHCKGVDAMVSERSAGIATLVVEKPNSDGHVTFANWDHADRRLAVASLWDGFVAGLRRQAKETGSLITPSGWAVEPTLDRDHDLLFYAFSMDWDGHPLMNAKAAIFDRRGYIAFRIVPVDESISKKGLEKLVRTISASYRPAEGEAYDDFENGDNIAPDGALGAVAEMVDVPLHHRQRTFTHSVENVVRRGWLPLLLILLAGMIYLATGRTKAD